MLLCWSWLFATITKGFQCRWNVWSLTHTCILSKRTERIEISAQTKWLPTARNIWMRESYLHSLLYGRKCKKKSFRNPTWKQAFHWKNRWKYPYLFSRITLKTSFFPTELIEMSVLSFRNHTWKQALRWHNWYKISVFIFRKHPPENKLCADKTDKKIKKMFSR